MTVALFSKDSLDGTRDVPGLAYDPAGYEPLWILALRTFAPTVIFLSGHRLAIAEMTLFESAELLLRGDDRFAAC